MPLLRLNPGAIEPLELQQRGLFRAVVMRSRCAGDTWKASTAPNMHTAANSGTRTRLIAATMLAAGSFTASFCVREAELLQHQFHTTQRVVLERWRLQRWQATE
jgi:hypothetical protein